MAQNTAFSHKTIKPYSFCDCLLVYSFYNNQLLVANMAVKKCCVKLSPNKKSIFGLRMNTQIMCLVVGACILTVASAADTQISCTNVRNIFEKKGMLSASAVDLQTQPNSDIDGICLSKGCCGPASRTRLTNQAKTQLEGALRSELNKLADMLANKASRFDEFFRKLLKLSREEFHSMFKRTYGMIYEQHSYVFEQLFEQLDRYYTRGDTNFSVMMDGFFGILYEKMFTVLNSQYQFDSTYLKCVNENMRDIQPFEDVPNKLTMQLKRAVVATRTFHKALRAGAEVVRNMIQAGITAECVTAWTRLQYCGACGGASQPACSRYCHNVIRGCLPAHADISEYWDGYVEAVEKVSDRLLGPFNIAMVVEPIDIKISEAIMSFQEHNQEISQKIFAGCGKPVLGGGGGTGPFSPSGKSRRSARSIPDFHWTQDKKANDVDDFEIEGSIESLYNEKGPYVSRVNNGEIQIPTRDEIQRELQGFAERAELRSRFLDYLRGNLELAEYEALKKKARAKRDADPEPASASEMDIDFKSYEFDGKKGPKKKKPAAKNDDGHGSEWGGPALERLVKETRTRARNTKNFWRHLPALLCTPVSVPSAPCFNGTDVGSYSLAAAGEGLTGQASNPEVRGVVNAQAVTTAQAQGEMLRKLTAKLKDAYNGQEVDWPEDNDRDQQSAAVNIDEYTDELDQGSGSGDYNSGDDGPPDDDEDSEDVDGSGDFEPATDLPIAPTTEPENPGSPNVVDPPGTNNVFVRTRVQDPPETLPPDQPEDTGRPEEKQPAREEPAREHPVAGSADRPSLQKALFTYALPVVCAWFGTIVTDLF